MFDTPVILNETFQSLKDADATAAVFLKNGIRLIGKIRKIDPEAILMSGPTTIGLAVTRDTIATVQEFSTNTRQQETPPMKR